MNCVTFSPRARAFTLIEISVTLILVGVLMGLAVVGYQTLQNKASDTNASNNSDRVILAEQSLFSDWGTFSPYAADVSRVGSDVTVVENITPSEAPETVSISVSDKGTLGVAVMSKTGVCQRVAVRAPTAASSTDPSPVTRPDSAPCTGAESFPPGETAAAFTPGGTVKVSS